MGALDDYVSGLENKESLDPVVIASTLLELHNKEMEMANNKIASLEVTIEEKDSAYTTLGTELRDMKAKNWDLVNRVPVSTKDPSDGDSNPGGTDPSEASMDQFFKSEE